MSEPDPTRDRLALAALVAVNLIPVLGVLWLDWDVASIVILYWLENLVIGFYTLVKILHRQPLTGLLPAAFFCLHYGGFCGVHGLFVLMLTGGEQAGEGMFPDGEDTWPAHLVFLHLLVLAVQKMMATAAPGVMLAWLGLFLSHGLSLALNYFMGGEYRDRTVGQLMSAPYKRILVLHVAIIAGGWVVMSLGSPVILLIALVVLKILIDIRLHRRSHRQAVPGT